MVSAVAAATEEQVVKTRAARINPDYLLAEITDPAILAIVKQAIETAKARAAAERTPAGAWKLPIMAAVDLPATLGDIYATSSEPTFNLTIQFRDGLIVGKSVIQPRVAGAPRKARVSKSGKTLNEVFGTGAERRPIPLGTVATYDGKVATFVSGGVQLDGQAQVYKSLNALALALGYKHNVWATWQTKS